MAYLALDPPYILGLICLEHLFLHGWAGLSRSLLNSRETRPGLLILSRNHFSENVDRASLSQFWGTSLEGCYIPSAISTARLSFLHFA